MLRTVEIAGLLDMATSLKAQITALQFIKNLEFILWTMNIGKLRILTVAFFESMSDSVSVN